MSDLSTLNNRLLLTSSLIEEKYLKKALSELPGVKDPVSYFIAKGYVHKKDFYKKLAHELNLDYVQDLPVSTSTHNSFIHKIPLSLITENNIFLFKQKETLFIATSNPFLNSSLLKKLLSFSEAKNIRLQVADPQTIHQALSHTYYPFIATISTSTLDTMHPTLSAKAKRKTKSQQIFLVFLLASILLPLIFFPVQTLTVLFIGSNIYYFLVNPLKMYIFFRSLAPLSSLTIGSRELSQVNYDELPVYTILVPLKNESAVVPHLVSHLKALSYPKDKLDIKFAVEVDDEQTIKALEAEGIGTSSSDASALSLYTQLVKVPTASISTKPRSCNYALAFARGMYTVIYDAEDRPEPTQLLKAYVGFMKSKLNVICIQARLNFYNSRQNLLTKFFSLEYGFWFDYFLPGLQEIDTPIPLGGTSNHFITSELKKLGTWDPYNVTEDADLGLRLFRMGKKTAVMNSYTLEEANSQLKNWMLQRTRWEKGFLQTFLVHIANPKKLYKQTGLKGLVFSFVTFGANFFQPLLNPFLWIVFVLSFIPNIGEILPSNLPVILRFTALFNLTIGNLSYMAVHAFSAFKNKRPDLLPLTLLLPIYWFIFSWPTYRAVHQLLTNPYHWDKTKHGLTPAT